MEFSSLVLMEKDKNTNLFSRELGSYEVNDGAKYITKMFYDGEKINVFFDTEKDLEEWEYTAAYDLIDESIFINTGFSIEDVEDEYNPTWLVKFEFIEDHMAMQEKINHLCSIIEDEMERIFSGMQGKEEDYK